MEHLCQCPCCTFSHRFITHYFPVYIFVPHTIFLVVLLHTILSFFIHKSHNWYLCICSIFNVLLYGLLFVRFGKFHGGIFGLMGLLHSSICIFPRWLCEEVLNFWYLISNPHIIQFNAFDISQYL